MTSTKGHQIRLLATKYGAKNIRIFGSMSQTDSEVDVAVQMEPGRTFLDLIGLWKGLEELLGIKVDLIDEGGIGK